MRLKARYPFVTLRIRVVTKLSALDLTGSGLWGRGVEARQDMVEECVVLIQSGLFVIFGRVVGDTTASWVVHTVDHPQHRFATHLHREETTLPSLSLAVPVMSCTATKVQKQ
jgi:hypothetical protein